jgi:hypothetical protein
MPVKSSVVRRIVALFKKQIGYAAAMRKGEAPSGKPNIAAIAREVGKSRTHVYRVLRAESLIAQARQPVKQGKVSKKK